MADNDAARELATLAQQLNDAERQWGLYADVLADAYRVAYGRHTEVLQRMANVRRAEAEAHYFLLSTLTVGLAGGFVGGLMAPWVQRAGDVLTTNAIREAIVGVGQQTVSQFGDAAAKWMSAPAESYADLSPAVRSPFEVYLGIRIQLGIACAVVRDAIGEFRREANRKAWSKALGVRARQALGSIAILRDVPATPQIPIGDGAEALARQIETAMWIAWAKAQDAEEWNIHARAVISARPLMPLIGSMVHLDALHALDPVGIRLLSICPQVPVTFTVDKGGPFEAPVVNLNQVRTMGRMLNGTFLKRVGDVIDSPHAVLRSLSRIRPIFVAD